MRTALLRAWSRLRAGLRTTERFALKTFQTDNLAHESLPDGLKRDLGLRDGRIDFRCDGFRQSKMLEAARLPQGPL
jgi:hypothetical protein